MDKQEEVESLADAARKALPHLWHKVSCPRFILDLTAAAVCNCGAFDALMGLKAALRREAGK